jgi:hypothetical protein
MALKTTETNVRTPNTPVNREVGDRNPDPITGAPGSHPTGVGIGAAAGGATGAAIGMAGGPIGAAIGAVAGAVVGGYAGKAAGEWNDPTDEEAFWRDNYTTRPYYKAGESFDEYAPAYRYGSTVVREYPDRPFADVEDDIRTGYEESPDAATLPYDRARAPIEDAYTRSAQMRAERLRNAELNR